MKTMPREGRLFIHKNRIITGILMLALAAALALLLIPHYLHNNQTTYPIITVTHQISAGSILQDSDLTKSQTSDPILSGMGFASANDVIGKTVSRNLSAGSFLLQSDITDTYHKSTIYNTLPDNHFMIAVSVTSLAQSVAGQIKANDIVRLYAIREDGTAYTPKELQYVMVLATYNTNGEELGQDNPSTGSDDPIGVLSIGSSDARGNSTGATRENPAVITLLVTQEQALRVVELEKSNTLTFTLVSRDQTERANGFLNKQREVLSSTKGGFPQ